ncbi:unnamed protein product [Sphenostylis stenocarpa]|uniref:Uncharacterized protein n=1 Tax=Sphenostylis stenocarpa TaxID=92480 RepID=A0AA86SR04_9FABA|nr:unnamed protein product [Sphenostylis stenocarpa]
MCMPSVTCPVENLAQWEAIKAKVTSSYKQRSKENVPQSKRKVCPLAQKQFSILHLSGEGKQCPSTVSA